MSEGRERKGRERKCWWNGLAIGSRGEGDDWRAALGGVMCLAYHMLRLGAGRGQRDIL